MNLIEIIFIFILLILLSVVLFSLSNINITLRNSLLSFQNNISEHLFSSQNTVQKITENLSELKNATQNIIDTGKNIQSLQDILKPPKSRGIVGEIFLEQILSQVLPVQYFEMYYKFQNGNIVDAVVKLVDSKLLPIDSKFPLDSLKDYFSDSLNDKREIPTQFIRDVRKHIDDVSKKYIAQNENTLDFALMYIPAESVYYEILLKDEKLMQYSRDKKVVIVSPNTIYAYLSVIMNGLKGFEIEKNARNILNYIDNLRNDIEQFVLEYEKIGTHLINAKSKYDTSRIMINDISSRIKTVDVTKDGK